MTGSGGVGHLRSQVVQGVFRAVVPVEVIQEADIGAQRDERRFTGTVGADLAAPGAPRPVPVLITVGTIEENRANNEAMVATLRRQHHPVTVRIVPDAHTMIGWRDAWFPALDELIANLH